MAEEHSEADRMQAELDRLDEHIGDARKKAHRTREQADLDDGEFGGEIVGDFHDTARTDEDPSGAIDDPPQQAP